MTIPRTTLFALKSPLLASLAERTDASSKTIAATAEEYQIGSGPAKDVREPYEQRIAEVAGHNTFDSDIADRDRIKLGVIALANRERELITSHFRERSVSRRTLEQLLVSVEDIVEVDLGPDERSAFAHSAAAVEELVDKLVELGELRPSTR